MKIKLRQNCAKEPWQIAAARFCVMNSEKGFTENDLRKYIKSLYKVTDVQLTQFLTEEISLPPGSKYNRNQENGKWTPPLDLVSKITDYDELREARKNAKQAFWLAIAAIIISAVTLIVSIFKK